jgi:uncharacterized protein YndB with AHSA1/START domain
MSTPPTLQLRHTLDASPAAVYACLTDTDLFAATHPLIYRVASLGGQRFRMYERMPGLRWLRFSYPAEIVGDSQRLVVQMRAKVFGLVSIAMAFELQPTALGCTVEETVDIQTRLPVRKLAAKVFRAQHVQWFQNIAARAEETQAVDL